MSPWNSPGESSGSMVSSSDNVILDKPVNNLKQIFYQMFYVYNILIKMVFDGNDNNDLNT